MLRILAIDAGTTGVTALVLDEHGEQRGRGYREFPQHYPQPGWVEHDPEQIWEATIEAAIEALSRSASTAGQLTALGITNQRETTVLWHRRSGRPIHRAIVWQDRRTAGHCERLRDDGHAGLVRRVSGLVVDAYFSGTKLAWLLEHVDGARDAAEQGDLAFGTVDTWLLSKLTGGRIHATEPSNASRTMLFDIHEGAWSEELCALLGVPMTVLPAVQASAGTFGRTDPGAFLGADVPITGILGDQQAALFGQGCWTPGTSKNTYGTGSFVLLNTGASAPDSERLLTSCAWDLGGLPGQGERALTYVLEGSIFATGATIQWLRDGLSLISTAAETGPVAETVADTGDVYLVPAFAGLGAPHWDPHARGTLVGMTRGTTRAHILRAAVEAMAYQTRDVIEVMEADSGVGLSELRVDGGAAAMDLLCQFQADLLGVDVLRPTRLETTGLGAGYLAGLGAGMWASTDELAQLWQLDRRFEPGMPRDEADRRQARWREALDRSRGWAQSSSAKSQGSA